MILALNENMVAGAVAGERRFESVESGDGCCGGGTRELA